MKKPVPKPATVDFETFGIEGRPKYPPLPVGVSIKYPGKPSKYYAFGHIEGNNCFWGDAEKALKEVWSWKDGLVFQNGKFDLDVAESHFGLPIPNWERCHDTLFLLFLDDPHQTELGLKPASERLLGLPPDEQDEVKDWLIKNQPIPGVKISKSRNSPHFYGRYINFAPGELVGKYAVGDTDRTELLFNLLYKDIVNRGMLVAYERERKLMPILLEMERQGIAVDHKRLRDDVKFYTDWNNKLTEWIIKRLKAPADINLNSGAELMAAMIKAKCADPDLIPLTETGKLQTNKEALLVGVTDKVLLGVLKYRTQLNTCLNTFMSAWLRVADKSDGLIYTTWNQTKTPSGDSNVGTRTGRLSSTPNFQNIPKEFNPIFQHDELDTKKRKLLPKCPFPDLPRLPKVRSYITPFKGEIFIDRDYCFGPGTEVLTEQGFTLFEELEVGTKIAQWQNGEITYAVPKEYQVIHHQGELINIIGDRSTDLLVTPNHQCMVAKDNQTTFFRADEYPTRQFKQVHAGITPGRIMLPDGAVQLLAAIQADATVKSSTVAWKLKKTRKIERLHDVLSRIGLEFKTTLPVSTPGYMITYVNLNLLPEWVRHFLGESLKSFSRLLIELAAPLRLLFLKELAWWDGRRNGKDSWSYFTAHGTNGDVVQELASLTGLRSVKHTQVLKSGKIFTTISMRTNYLTCTDTFKSIKVPYEGPVYCVTMDHGTVVVRRNGKVCVTGQSQQEPRILAHFDGGTLMDKYIENPWIDFHDFAKAELEIMGLFYERKPVKNTNLGLIYGMGKGKLAAKNDMSVDEADKLKKAILLLYPGLKQMYADMRLKAKMKEAVTTWGGRQYFCEEPKLIQGRMRTFDYKLVNVLIQGSAADCTKEALIRFHEVKDKTWKIVLNVHDQITVSVPNNKPTIVKSMQALKDTMESVEFDVKMLSEGETSSTNWAELKTYDKKGVLL